MQIPDLKSGEDKLELKIEASIWQHKQFKISLYGGIVAPVPRPTPRSFSVFGLLNTGIEEGDYILVARDMSTNKTFSESIFRDNQGGEIITVPGLVKLEENCIRQGLVGKVRYIEGNRITLWSDLTVEGTMGVVSLPKVNGAVSKIISKDRTMVSESLTNNVDKAKKIHGSKWAEKMDDGAWLK